MKFFFLYFSILFWNLLRIFWESWTCQESHMVSGGFSIKTKYSFLIWLHIENKVNIVTKVAAGWQGNLRNQLRLFSRDHRDAIRFGHRDSAFIEIMRKINSFINHSWIECTIILKIGVVVWLNQSLFTWPFPVVDVVVSVAVCSATGRRKPWESLSNCRRGYRWPSHLLAGCSAQLTIPNTLKCYRSITKINKQTVRECRFYEYLPGWQKNNSVCLGYKFFKFCRFP